LVKENEEAAKVYMRVRDQVLRAGVDGTIVGLNQLAIWPIIDAYGIKDKIGVFDKVINCWHEVRKKQEG